MHVLVANNYSIGVARSLVEADVYPRQHLWGSDGLERRGIRVTYVPSGTRSRIGRFAQRFDHVLGDPDQQRAIARIALQDRSAVCFSADPRTIRSLQLLRGLGAWRAPICCVFHHRVPAPGLLRRLRRGLDSAICLNKRSRETLIDVVGMPQERVCWLPWGPDLEFPGYQSHGDDGEFILSAGKTNRDLHTLVRALRQVDFPARVHSQAGLTDVPANVEIVEFALAARGRREQHPFAAVLPDMQRAAVFAICIEDPNRLTGLSELNDALALGKPVVMTRSPYLDIDIERVGCGIWVERGDVAGWKRALEELAGDPGLRRAMGERGRRFAEREWNYGLFRQGVVAAITAIAPDRQSARVVHHTRAGAASDPLREAR
jgi:glycosyltransferase involved in cell wall biosynthesis